MIEKHELVPEKSLAEIEVDELIESLRQSATADVDETLIEWLCNRLIVGVQGLRDLRIHHELGLPLPPSLITKSNIAYEVWRFESEARQNRFPVVLVDGSCDLSSFGNGSTHQPMIAVPSAAETIISYVCTPDRLEAVLGDLERNFARRATKQGEKAARGWYWWQTARTVAAFGFQIVVKAVLLRELLRKLRL